MHLDRTPLQQLLFFCYTHVADELIRVTKETVHFEWDLFLYMVLSTGTAPSSSLKTVSTGSIS